MPSSRKALLNKVHSFMNPLRRLALDSRPKRNLLVTKPKPDAKKKHPVVGPKPAWHPHPVPVGRPGPSLVLDPNKVKKLTQGDYVAEITVNRKSAPVLFHYLVVKKDSPEILEWGQTVSVHAAIAKAKSALRRLSARDSAPGHMVAAD